MRESVRVNGEMHMDNIGMDYTKIYFWVGKKAISWIKSLDNFLFLELIKHNSVFKNIKVDYCEESTLLHWWGPLIILIVLIGWATFNSMLKDDA